ncbi:hypothetical protein E3N88_20187 [Mikania micrantha]|uniref:F-box domain-containing protein n=1 Tax=Mikania micrantha TaxID=192012 RepID=A0A5N6NGR7_9ASTR|nr:hypothetical protein E3N88_20187 [Mikania micrantha]
MASTGDHETTAEWRRWDGLNPEILALIFVRIKPVDQMVRAVTLVCKGWREVVLGPYCWSEVDLKAWCRGRIDGLDVDLLVRKLVRRSKYSVERLSVYRIGESAFFHVAHCGSFLKELQIPTSTITDQMVLKHLTPLPNLRVLDVSYCFRITSKGLAAFGRRCDTLIHLRRNMPPITDGFPATDDSEAKAIADTMPNLYHIELCFGQFGDPGLLEIVTTCKLLTYLDIEGCWNVELNGDVRVMCERLQQFHNPWVGDDSTSDDDETNTDSD